MVAGSCFTYPLIRSASAPTRPSGSPSSRSACAGPGGGPYLDAALAGTSGLAGWRPEVGAAATLGWDYRPVRWLSVKGGAGVASSSLAEYSPETRRLIVDLNAGLVF